MLSSAPRAGAHRPGRYGGRYIGGVLFTGTGRRQRAGGLHAGENVKKPAGGRPGMVIYTTYRTVNVTPDAEAVKAMQLGK